MDSTPVNWIVDSNCYVFECPHCGIPIQVEDNQVNCHIFRHGQTKNTYMVRLSSGNVRDRTPLSDIDSDPGVQLRTGDRVRVRSGPTSTYENAQILSVQQGQQIPPHASKRTCDELVAQGLIWGCGKPFKLIRGASGRVETAKICDYI